MGALTRVAIVFVAGLGVSACAATGEDEAAPPVEQLQEPLGAGVPDVVGAWQGKMGPLAGLLLVANEARGGQVFVGELLAGSRIEGRWLVSSRQLALRDSYGWHVFSYVRSGGELMLYSGLRRYARLVHVDLFCNQDMDCALQDYFHEMCVGMPVCLGRFSCGWECMGSSSPCDGYLCTTGEHCSSATGSPTCAPDDPSACAAVRCGADRPRCVASEGETQCIGLDTCHRDTECEAGKHCQSEIECFTAPCFARLVCR